MARPSFDLETGGPPPERLRAAGAAGVVAVLPTLAMVAPFGVLSGALSAEAGLDVWKTFALSVIVFAGASQIVAIDMLANAAPWIVVVATGLALNLRFAMYAASLGPWLGGAAPPTRVALGYLNVDNCYGVAIARFRRAAGMTVGERAAFFLAGGGVTWACWQIATGVGFALGAGLPPELSLDFAAPIAFAALVFPLLRDGPSWTAAAVACVVALTLKDLPYHLNVIVAAIVAILVGRAVERAGENSDGENQRSENQGGESRSGENGGGGGDG